MIATTAPSCNLTAVQIPDIDVESLRSDLAELVSFGAVGGTSGELTIQRWCANQLTEMGLTVDTWDLDLAQLRSQPDYPGEETTRREAIGVVGTSGPGTPELILAGHVDVVPAADSGWTGNPFALREISGSWVGRGVCDMLGGVAAILAAVRAVPKLRLPFAVHTVIGEEDGGIGTFATLQRHSAGAACVIAEPTARAIINANAGSLTFTLELAGSATHGATRLAGFNPLHLIPDLLAALQHLESDRNSAPPPGFDELPYPISVGTINGGQWASTVPDQLTLTGRYGVKIGESLPQARSAFEAAIASIDHPWLHEHPITVRWAGGTFAPGSTPVDHPFVQQVVALTGAECRGAPYGSDLRLYSAAGIPTVQFGPGDVADAHSVDEKVRIDDVIQAARAYAQLLIARCS